VFRIGSSSRANKRAISTAGLVLVAGIALTGCTSSNGGNGGGGSSTSASESKDIAATATLDNVSHYEEMYQAENGQYASTIAELQTVTKTQAGVSIPKFAQVPGISANVSATADGDHYIAAVVSGSGHIFLVTDSTPNKKTYKNIGAYRTAKSPVEGAALPSFG
jgi:hypothetical protein